MTESLHDVTVVTCPLLAHYEPYGCKSASAMSPQLLPMFGLSFNDLDPEVFPPLFPLAHVGLSTDPESALLAELLNAYEHTGLFSTHELDIGCLSQELTDRYPFRIRLHSEVQHFIPPYKASHAEWTWFDGILPGLLAADVIEPAFDPCGNPSPYASSPYIIPKKEPGEYRFTVDFREINAGTIRDAFPAPDPVRSLDLLAGSHWFSALDLTSGYWQVEIDPDSRQYAAFRTRDAHYQFKRLAMGLTNACAHFQRIIQSVLLPDCADFVVIYLDDIIVHTKGDFDDHLSKLAFVFDKLIAAGLKLKRTKCQLGARALNYLGHIISGDGVRTDPKKVEAVAAMPFPKDASGVRSFLGMTGYYANFIKDYALKASTLFASTAHKYLWSVSSAMRDAFQALKDALLSDPVLRQPDFTRPFVLTTDWSEEAQGAVLGQLDDDDAEYAIQYASHRNSPAEANYAPSHGECAAIIRGITKFRYYLQGHKFHLKTDHRALQWLHTAQFGNPKLARWSLQLQEYDFTVAHCRGDHNVVADHLSRMDPIDPAAQDPIDPYHKPTLAALSVFRDDDFHNHSQYESAFACNVCNRTTGGDNMAICDSCGGLYHLRCLTPPMSSVPSGEWICSHCAPPSDPWAELF